MLYLLILSTPSKYSGPPPSVDVAARWVGGQALTKQLKPGLPKGHQAPLNPKCPEGSQQQKWKVGRKQGLRDAGERREVLGPGLARAGLQAHGDWVSGSSWIR